jgi:hypothetical protein
MSVDHERLLGASYLHDLEGRSVAEVRAMRDECVEVETGLSYLRRLVQGPLDIVRHELQARADGGGGGDVSHLVEELAEVLADGPRGAGTGRLSTTMEPARVDEAFAAELESLTGAARSADVPGLSDGDLSALAESLTDLERRISDRRQAYFAQIDQLQAELTRRYREGEASVDALLEGR